MANHFRYTEYKSSINILTVTIGSCPAVDLITSPIRYPFKKLTTHTEYEMQAV